jgi:hypothetical protein
MFVLFVVFSQVLTSIELDRRIRRHVTIGTSKDPNEGQRGLKHPRMGRTGLPLQAMSSVYLALVALGIPSVIRVLSVISAALFSLESGSMFGWNVATIEVK